MVKLDSNREKSLDVQLEWKGEKRSIAKIREFTIPIDNPREKGGTDEGPMPTELLLASLGSCTMIGFTYFAKKMRVNLRNLRLTVSGIKAEEKNPRFSHINILADFEGEDIDSQKLHKLTKLAEKYCTVGNTIKNRTTISVQICPKTYE
jgi:uncharacterized OsmC-like protein